MFCISVNFKKTPLSIRQQFAFSKEEQQCFLSELIEKKIINGGVVVSTCNRSEIYFTGERGRMTEMEEVLSSIKKIEREHIKKYCLYYQGKKAVRHLFRVACGLDSMVLGEDEILHQVKEAYLFASDMGYTNGELNILFQGALNCAKLSKTTTKLSNTPVSIGTLTANEVEKFLKQLPEESGRSVLVIGATGKIGSIVAKDLIAKGISVIGTSRKRSQMEGLFLQDNDNMEWLDFEKRYDALSKVTVIVSATASPHYTLIREEFLQYAEIGKTYLMIDLAVPFDIDKEIGRVENVTLFDIDYFQKLSRENSNIKLGEIDKVESILQECMEDVLKKLYIRNFKDKMTEKYEEEWFRKMLHYLRDVLSSDQLLEMFNRMYQKEVKEMAYFPFMIDIANQNCLVVGGGSIAFHKVKLLSDFGVHIKVIGSDICQELRQFAKEKQVSADIDKSSGRMQQKGPNSGTEDWNTEIEEQALGIEERAFQDSDIDGMDFVVAATDDEDLNNHISDLCRQRRILVNVVDRKEACSFIVPAIIQDKDLLVAVSTGGQSPAAAGYVKRKIKSRIPEYYGDMVETLGEYREYVLQHVDSAKNRKEIFNRLLEYGDSHDGEIPIEIMEQTVAEIRDV